MTRPSSSSKSSNTSARSSVNTAARTRAERSQGKSERFETLRMAVHARQAAQRDRYVNAFKRAGSAFRMWWLMLVGVMSEVVRPIVRHSATPTRRARRIHSMVTPALATAGIEGLETRLLLTPFVTTNQLTISQGATVVLDESNINSDPFTNYTVATLSGGQFEFISNKGVAATTFSQPNITAKVVQFVHDGGTDAHWGFTVSVG